MADLAFTAANIRPLLGSVTRPYQCGAVVAVGDVVYVAADGDVEICVADGAATAQGIGIVTAIGAYGKLTSVAGDMVDVTTFGAIEGWTSLTPGDLVFVSAVDGNVADAAPAATNFIWVMGRVETAGQIYINPWTYDVVVVS